MLTEILFVLPAAFTFSMLKLVSLLYTSLLLTKQTAEDDKQTNGYKNIFGNDSIFFSDDKFLWDQLADFTIWNNITRRPVMEFIIYLCSFFWLFLHLFSVVTWINCSENVFPLIVKALIKNWYIYLLTIYYEQCRTGQQQHWLLNFILIALSICWQLCPFNRWQPLIDFQPTFIRQATLGKKKLFRPTWS